MIFFRKSSLLLILFLTSPSILYASVEKDIEDFLSNRVHVFDSKGHPKAKNIRITFIYPQSWVAIEADRPNVVKKFMKAENNALVASAIHIVNALDREKYTNEQVRNEVFRKNLFKEFGDNYEYVKSGNTMVENENAIWTVYIQNFATPSINLSLYCLAYSFYFSNKHITILYSVGGSSEDKYVISLFDNYFPLFEVMITRTTLPDKWN